MVEHQGELIYCPFRTDGADFAYCYRDDRCPCYEKRVDCNTIWETCYREGIAYNYRRIVK